MSFGSWCKFSLIIYNLFHYLYFFRLFEFRSRFLISNFIYIFVLLWLCIFMLIPCVYFKTIIQGVVNHAKQSQKKKKLTSRTSCLYFWHFNGFFFLSNDFNEREKTALRRRTLQVRKDTAKVIIIGSHPVSSWVRFRTIPFEIT